MKWNIFGKKLSKDLHQYSSEVDPLEIWANIEPQVDALNARKKKDRKPIFWIFLFGLSSILGILILSQIFNVDSSQLYPPSTQEKSTIQNDVPQYETESNNDQNSYTEVSKSQTSKPKKAFSKPSSSIQNIAPKNNSVPLNLQLEKLQSEQHNQKSQNQATSNSSSRKNQTSKFSILNNSETLVATSKVKQSQNTEITKDTPNVEERKEASNSITSIEARTNKDLSGIKIEDEQLTLDLIPTLAVLNPLSSNEYEFTDDDLPVLIYNEHKNLTKPLKQKIKWSIQAYLGSGMIHRKIVSKSPEHDNLLNLRKRTESVLEAQQFGLQVNIGKELGLQFTTGIQATYLIEKFEFLDLIRDTVLNPGLQYRYVALRGDTLNLNGQIPTYQRFEYNKKIYNSHRLFEIPLLIGYKTRWNNLGITIYTGIFANVSLTSEGEILDLDNVFVSVRETGSNIYKSNIGLSYHFGLELEKKFTNNLSIQLKPTFQYYVNNFTSTSYGLEQHYWILGGNLGLKYTF